MSYKLKCIFLEAEMLKIIPLNYFFQNEKMQENEQR